MNNLTFLVVTLIVLVYTCEVQSWSFFTTKNSYIGHTIINPDVQLNCQIGCCQIIHNGHIIKLKGTINHFNIDNGKVTIKGEGLSMNYLYYTYIYGLKEIKISKDGSAIEFSLPVAKPAEVKDKDKEIVPGLSESTLKAKIIDEILVPDFWGQVKVNDGRVDKNGTTIIGHNNKITGDGNTIKGHNNHITGNANNVIGDRNSITGDENSIFGGHNKAYGKGNQAIGLHNRNMTIPTRFLEFFGF